MKKRSPQEQHAHLSMLNKRGQLCLFVGAGVSQECGLPSWNVLIERLSAKAFPSDEKNIKMALEGYSNTAKTRILRSILGSGFNKAVSDCLYAEPITISKNLETIADCGIKRILTYNFDELIEEALASANIEFDAFEPGDAINSNYRGAIVFHPHGLITPIMDEAELTRKSIVLSEEDYNQLNMQPYSWGNVIQLGLLTQFTCLFVGVSLADPNTRKLLDVCRALKIGQMHYVIFKSPLYAVADLDKPVAKLLKKSIETDLKSLGVQPIWVKRWDEIAKLFKRIKTKKNLQSKRLRH
jgi:SIR2-like domain